MANDNVNDYNFSEVKFNGVKQAQKVVTFDGLVGSGRSGTASLFSVTGDVLVKLFAVCTASLTGTSVASISVGTSGTASGLIATTSPGTALVAGNIWHDASPDAGLELSSVVTEKILANGASILMTVGSSNLTGGSVRFVCLYKPLSIDGEVLPS